MMIEILVLEILFEKKDKSIFHLDNHKKETDKFRWRDFCNQYDENLNEIHELTPTPAKHSSKKLTTYFIKIVTEGNVSLRKDEE